MGFSLEMGIDEKDNRTGQGTYRNTTDKRRPWRSATAGCEDHPSSIEAKRRVGTYFHKLLELLKSLTNSTKSRQNERPRTTRTSLHSLPYNTSCFPHYFLLSRIFPPP